VPEGGGDGMLVTAGGKWGGYGLYLLKGKPVFDYNMLILAQYRWEGSDVLTPGKHTIVFDYTYDGPGIAKGGTGVLKVDGNVVATQKQPRLLSVAATIEAITGLALIISPQTVTVLLLGRRSCRCRNCCSADSRCGVARLGGGLLEEPRGCQ
jgi:hypothetical protein